MCRKMNTISRTSHRLSTFLLLSPFLFFLHHPVLCPRFFPSCFSYLPFSCFSHFSFFFSLWLFLLSFLNNLFHFVIHLLSQSFYSSSNLSSLNLASACFTPHSHPTHMLIITLVFNLPLTSHLFIISMLPISSHYRQTMLLLAAHIRNKETFSWPALLHCTVSFAHHIPLCSQC